MSPKILAAAGIACLAVFLGIHHYETHMPPDSPHIRRPIPHLNVLSPPDTVAPVPQRFFHDEMSWEISQNKNENHSISLLKNIDISQLRLVAIIRTESGNKAMVQDADGKGYMIRCGMTLGLYAGKVIEILEDRVIVEEKHESDGEIIYRKRELVLRK